VIRDLYQMSGFVCHSAQFGASYDVTHICDYTKSA